MKSMTIHGIDEELAKLIKSKAESEGLSINKTIKQLLEVSLGVKPMPNNKNINEFKNFCGKWSNEDLEEFERNTIDMRSVDPKDWQ